MKLGELLRETMHIFLGEEFAQNFASTSDMAPKGGFPALLINPKAGTSFKICILFYYRMKSGELTNSRQVEVL